MQWKLEILLEGGSIKRNISARCLSFTCTRLRLWSAGFCRKRSCRRSSCGFNRWMQQGRDEKVTHWFQLIYFLDNCFFSISKAFWPTTSPVCVLAACLVHTNAHRTALVGDCVVGGLHPNFLRSTLLHFGSWSSVVPNALLPTLG